MLRRAEASAPQGAIRVGCSHHQRPVLRDRDPGAGGDLGKSGSGLDQRLYYTTDANMNVPALLDTAGDAVERYSCDPYGRVTVYSDDWSTTVDWDDSKKNPVRYCGYFFDNETGLYCVRYRYYVPLLGRWLQRDRIGYADGMGLYEYVRSMPCNATDAYGERSLPESGLGSIGDSGHNGSDSRQACRFASVPEASECCETQEPVEMRRRGGPSLTPKPPPLPVNYGPGGTCAAGCHSPPRGLGSQYGWEAGLLVGVGQSTVCCCDECNYIRIMHFDKVCLGGIAGASVGAGVVAGIDGESCRAESYEGWFSEWGVTAGLVGASANVGMERPDFLSPTGVVETQGNAGVGAKAKVFVFCKYSLIKETILSSEDAKRRCQSRH